MTAPPPDIRIQEVAPATACRSKRNGSKQRENPADQFALCVGFSRIEVSSFGTAAVPSLRDATDVFTGIERGPARSIGADPEPEGR